MFYDTSDPIQDKYTSSFVSITLPISPKESINKKIITGINPTFILIYVAKILTVILGNNTSAIKMNISCPLIFNILKDGNISIIINNKSVYIIKNLLFPDLVKSEFLKCSLKTIFNIVGIINTVNPYNVK